MLSSPAQCWECERPARFPRLVTVRLPDFTIGPLTLCADCYTSIFVPLVASLGHRCPQTGVEQWILSTGPPGASSSSPPEA